MKEVRGQFAGKVLCRNDYKITYDGLHKSSHCLLVTMWAFVGEKKAFNQYIFVHLKDLRVVEWVALIRFFFGMYHY